MWLNSQSVYFSLERNANKASGYGTFTSNYRECSGLISYDEDLVTSLMDKGSFNPVHSSFKSLVTCVALSLSLYFYQRTSGHLV